MPEDEEEIVDVRVVGDRLKAATLMVLQHENRLRGETDVEASSGMGDALLEEQVLSDTDCAIEALSSYLRIPIHISKPVPGVNAPRWNLIKAFGDQYASERKNIASHSSGTSGIDDDEEDYYHVINLSAEEDGFRVLIPREFSE